jgi:hypothetical protein
MLSTLCASPASSRSVAVEHGRSRCIAPCVRPASWSTAPRPR